MPLSKPRLPRRGSRWAATLALFVAAAVVVWTVVDDNSTPSQRTGAGTTATGATTVQRRNLVATDTESGTLSYDNQQTVYNRLSGTITWVPQVGQVIRPGHTLFMVDNKPVLLMNGATPAYRALTADDISGPDVYELNRNLVALGYNPDGIVIDDEWQSATTAGIDRLQYDLGETETGTLSLGQVVFLPGPQMIQTVETTVGSTAAAYKPASGTPGREFVDFSGSAPHGGITTADSRTVTTGTVTTGTVTTGTVTTGTGTTDTTTTGTSPAAGTGTTTTPTQTGSRTAPPPTRRTTAPKTHANPSTSGTDNLSRQTLRQLLRLVREQQRELQAEERAAHSPGPSSSGSSGSGGSNQSRTGKGSAAANSGNGSTGNVGSTGNGNQGGGGSAIAVLSTSSTKLVVTVDLSASSQAEATIGEHVTVQMPDGSDAGGRVTAVSPVAQSSSSDSGGNAGAGAGAGAGSGSGSGSGSSTVPVTIVLDRPARGGGLDQASVSVNFVQSKARNVLSVPVTALLATSGSTFAVQAAAPPHKLIPVQTGLFAAGYVAISGPGVHPGLQVTDSQG